MMLCNPVGSLLRLLLLSPLAADPRNLAFAPEEGPFADYCNGDRMKRANKDAANVKQFQLALRQHRIRAIYKCFENFNRHGGAVVRCSWWHYFFNFAIPGCIVILQILIAINPHHLQATTRTREVFRQSGSPGHLR